VWDLETFYQTRSLMHGAEVTAVAVSAGHLITGSADSTVKVSHTTLSLSLVWS
jgi:hypothetical protein